jgi:hypothetical protein
MEETLCSVFNQLFFCFIYAVHRFGSLISQFIGRYYEGGISSVYMWEDDNEGFVACFLIKKGEHFYLNEQ